MARNFSGGVANDRVTFGNYAAMNSLAPFSVAFWIWVTSYDSTFRRAYAKNTGTLGSSHSAVYVVDSTISATGVNALIWEASLWGTSNGNWEITGPSTGVWAHYCVTYAYSSTADNPTIYLNGSSVSVNENGTPSGSLGSESEDLTIGNRSASGRALNGRVAEFGMWGRILSSGEVAILANGHAPTFVGNGLVFYAPLIGSQSPEVNRYGASGTVTDSTAATHPRIIYPAPRWRNSVAAAAAAGQPIVKRMGGVPHMNNQSQSWARRW